MIQWNEDFAPGKTTYACEAAPLGNSTADWLQGSNASDEIPTLDFMRSALSQKDFVELAVYPFDNGPGHAVNLISISDGPSPTIEFQDPNHPTVLSQATLTESVGDPNNPNPYTDNYWLFSIDFGPAGTPEYVPMVIAAAFVESPIPEPSTVVLLIVGGAGFFVYAWRRRSRTAA